MSKLALAKKVMDEAKRRYESARIECEVANGAYIYAMADAAWVWCWEKRIFPPCKVSVNFEDGPTVMWFDRIEYSFNQPIVLKKITKRGQPCKIGETYEWDLVEIMERIPK